MNIRVFPPQKHQQQKEDLRRAEDFYLMSLSKMETHLPKMLLVGTDRKHLSLSWRDRGDLWPWASPVRLVTGQRLVSSIGLEERCIYLSESLSAVVFMTRRCITLSTNQQKKTCRYLVSLQAYRTDPWTYFDDPEPAASPGWVHLQSNASIALHPTLPKIKDGSSCIWVLKRVDICQHGWTALIKPTQPYNKKKRETYSSPNTNQKKLSHSPTPSAALKKQVRDRKSVV